MATDIAAEDSAPELLYHVKRTIIDYALDESGASQTTDILNTFTDLVAAKSASYSALFSEGYIKDDFVIYEENDGVKAWSHGEGVIVFAKAPSGHEFQVRLDTTPNNLKFKGNGSGEVEGHLYYVLQTTIDYNTDHLGGTQITEVQGTYPTRKSAYEAADTTIVGEEFKKETYAEYDEKREEKDEWPYGDDVLVHAVAETGENFNISVKTQPHKHRGHCNCKGHTAKG